MSVTTTTTVDDQAERTPHPWMAVLGPVVMGIALAGGPWLGDPLARWLSLEGFAARLVPAALVSLIAVPVVLRLGLSRRRLGLTGARDGVRAAALGLAVTGGAAALVFGAGTAAGWLSWSAVDAGDLLLFLATNGLVALLLEALPEELALRGFAFGVLRGRYRRGLSGLLTTALFLLVVPVATLRVAPAGEDPVAYVVLLVCFGTMLVAARTATAGGSIWACVAAHLTFLTVNRIVLFGAERDAGVSADLASPDVVLLVPLYVLLAAAGFALIGRAARSRSAGTGSPDRSGA